MAIWSHDPKANLVTPDFKNRYLNVIADHDSFVFLS
jgi:hypothetical protein